MLREGTCLTRHVCNNIYITIDTIRHSSRWVIRSRFYPETRALRPARTSSRPTRYWEVVQQDNLSDGSNEYENDSELQFEWTRTESDRQRASVDVSRGGRLDGGVSRGGGSLGHSVLVQSLVRLDCLEVARKFLKRREDSPENIRPLPHQKVPQLPNCAQLAHPVEKGPLSGVQPTSHNPLHVEKTPYDIHSLARNSKEADNGNTTIESSATSGVKPFITPSIEARLRREVDYPADFIPPETSMKVKKLFSRNFDDTVSAPPTASKKTSPPSPNINPTIPPKAKPPRTETEKIMAEALRRSDYRTVIKIFEAYSNSLSDNRSKPTQVDNELITTSVLNCYLAALVNLGHNTEAEQTLTLFDPSLDRGPTAETYALLLRAYIQAMDLRKARLLLYEMISKGIQMNNNLAQILVHGEGKWANSLESVDALMTLLFTEGVLLRNMKIYNLLIAAYLRRDRPDKARAVLDRVASDGLEPDEGTFLALMQYQGRKEGSEGVRVLLNSMKKSAITPGIKHLNTLIHTIVNEQGMDMRSAISLLKTHGVAPGTATCNIVLGGLLRRKFDQRALQNHFEQMETLKLRPNSWTFTILLNEYKRKNNNWQRVQKVLQHQKALNPKHVHDVTENVLVHFSMSQSAKPGRRFEVGNRLDFNWDKYTLTSCVAAYARSKDWSKVVDLYRQLEERRVMLDRRFYRVLIEALLNGRHYKESEEVAAILLKSDNVVDQILGHEWKIKISHTIWNETGCGKERVLGAVDRFLKFTDEKGIIISEKYCNLIAIAFLYAHHYELAVEILESRYHGRNRFQDLEEPGKLGMSAWTILMRAYSRKKLAGGPDLQSVIERALSDPSQRPTKAFRTFLQRLAMNENFEKWRPEYSDFFRRKEAEVTRLMASSVEPRTRGRSNLTKTSILKWVNNLTDVNLKGKLRDALNKGLDKEGIVKEGVS